jgi:glycosyltransferase involved in cell wall biosynthesis
MSSVDVVVPCYRYGRFLRQCVQSVLTQEEVSVRVLIIDDASPDDTAEIAAELCHEDSRVAFIKHATNKGHIATYNEGIEWVSSKYTILLSADDYLLPDALQHSVGLMENHPDVSFTFGNVRELGDEWAECDASAIVGVRGEADCRVMRGEHFIEISGSRNIVPTPTAVVRSELQKRLGGYRPELPHTADLEMWFRLAAQGSVGVVGAYQAVYRRHAANMSLAYYQNNRLPDLLERKAALDWFVNNQGHHLEHLPKMRKAMFRSLSHDAVGYASAAFNDGALSATDDLTRFALSVDSTVSASLAWRKLALKKILGIKGWRALRPAYERMRQLRVANGVESSHSK